MSVSCVVAALNFHFYYKDFQWNTDFSISKIFVYLSTDIFLYIQNIYGFLLIAFALGKDTCFDDFSPMVPRRPQLLIMMAVLGVGSSVQLIYTYTREDRKITALFMTLTFILNSTAMFASVFIIDVSANQFCNLVQAQVVGITLHNLQGRLTEVISDYRSLQNLLQALVFMIFITDSFLLITDAFLLIDNGDYFVFPFLVHYALRLSYIAYVLDDCYMELKAALPILRFYTFSKYVC